METESEEAFILTTVTPCGHIIFSILHANISTCSKTSELLQNNNKLTLLFRNNPILRHTLCILLKGVYYVTTHTYMYMYTEPTKPIASQKKIIMCCTVL